MGGDDDAEDVWITKEACDDLDAEIDPLAADESLVVSSFGEKREPPGSLVIPLLPYQKEFLAWAIQQELGPMRGGILAGARSSHHMSVDVSVTSPRELFIYIVNKYIYRIKVSKKTIKLVLKTSSLVCSTCAYRCCMEHSLRA